MAKKKTKGVEKVRIPPLFVSLKITVMALRTWSTPQERNIFKSSFIFPALEHVFVSLSNLPSKSIPRYALTNWI